MNFFGDLELKYNIIFYDSTSARKWMKKIENTLISSVEWNQGIPKRMKAADITCPVK